MINTNNWQRNGNAIHAMSSPNHGSCIAIFEGDNRHEHAEFALQACKAYKQNDGWLQGEPSPDDEVAWLLVGDPEDVKRVVLGVYAEDGWNESGDYKGESYKEAIIDPIIGWQPYVMPRAY